MPEGDRFDKLIRRGWDDVLAGIESDDAAPYEIAAQLIVPLTRDVKNGGGLPGLDKVGGIVAACVGSGGIEGAFSALDRVVIEHNGHRHTVVLARAAKTLLLTQEIAVTLSEHAFATARLIEQTCHDLVDNVFFGVGRYRLIESGRFSSEGEAREFERLVHEALAPAIRGMAVQLMVDSTGKAIKVPRSRTPKLSTQDILKQDINPV